MNTHKFLYLMRHAKSDWSDWWCRDYDRWLNARWKRDLKEFVPIVAEKIGVVDLLISSGAKRTRKTANACAKHLGYKKSGIQLDDTIYESGRDEVVMTMKKIPHHYANVLLVGHNPALNEFIQWCRVDCDNLPTAWVVCFEYLADDRAVLTPALLEFQWIEFPKKLR